MEMKYSTSWLWSGFYPCTHLSKYRGLRKLANFIKCKVHFFPLNYNFVKSKLSFFWSENYALRSTALPHYQISLEILVSISTISVHHGTLKSFLYRNYVNYFFFNTMLTNNKLFHILFQQVYFKQLLAYSYKLSQAQRQIQKELLRKKKFQSSCIYLKQHYNKTDS